MSDESDNGAVVIGGLLIFLLVGIIIGLNVGNGIAKQEIQKQAVEHNAAEWKVNTAGNVTFTWKEMAEQ